MGSLGALALLGALILIHEAGHLNVKDVVRIWG